MSADFTSLDKLVEKLTKACEKAPKASGEADVDAFLDGNVNAAKGAVASAQQLHNLYSRQIGESVDGVQDVTISKPTLEDWMNLASTVATQTAGMAELGVAGKNAAEATSFQGKASQECMSPEAAVNMAMQSIQSEIGDWFRANFPITCSVSRVLDNKTVLINAGTEQGVKPGNTFKVEAVEILDGHPYHKFLGEIKIKTVAVPYFSECEVPKKIMDQIKSHFDNADKIICELKQSK